MADFFCNECGYFGDAGPNHSGCNYHAARLPELEPLSAAEIARLREIVDRLALSEAEEPGGDPDYLTPREKWEGSRFLPRLLAEYERLTRELRDMTMRRDTAAATAISFRSERDEARAALQWLASRYQRLTPSGPYQRYGGGVTDEEWDAHVATALAEGA